MAGRIVEAVYIANIDDLKAKSLQAAALNEKMGASLGESFNKGTTKAGNAITSLSNKLGNLGIPLSGSIGKIGTALEQATTKSSKFLTVLSSIGKVGVAGGLAAFAAAAYEGVKGATALQQQMEMIHTQAGKSQTEVQNMTKAILGMAASVGTNPQQLATALYHIESAGFSGAAALNMLRTSAEGAKIGNADLTDTTQALAAVMYSGIPGAQSLSAAMGTLNATVGAGDMTMQQLNEAFQGPMLATVKGYGLSIKDVGAALADFGDLNIRGADAATQLRMAVQYMAKPAATAGPMLAQLGLNTQSFANALANGGLLPALDLLKSKLDAAKVPASQYANVISDLFSKKGSAGVEILINSMSRLQSKYHDVAAGAGSFNADWTSTTHNLSFEWSQVEAGAAAFADKLGGYLIPKLQELGAFVARNKTAFEDLAKVFLGIMAVAIGSFVGTQVASFVGGIAKMVVGVEGFILKYTTMRNVEIASNSMMAASAETTAVTIDAALIGTGIGAAIVALGIAATEMMTHWQTVMTAMSTATNRMADGVATALNAVVRAYNDTIGKIPGLHSNTQYYGPGQGPGQGPQNYSVSTGTADVPLKAGTTQAQYNKILSLYHAGQPLNQAESEVYGGKSGSYNLPIPKNYQPPTTTPTTSGGVLPPNLAAAAQSASSKTTLTLADVALENMANQFVATLKVASAGGTSMSQQGTTMANLRAAATHGAQEASLVASLNATQNPTLTRLATTIQSAWASMTAKIATIIDTDTKAGQSELTKLQNAQSSTSFTSLKDAVTGTAATSFQQLVTELNSTHEKALTNLASSLKATWVTTMAAYNSVLATLATTAQAGTLNVATGRLTGQTTAASNAGAAAVTLSGLQSGQTADQLSAAATALNDAAKLSSDAAAEQVQAIQAQTTAMADTANAQIAAIQDQTQTQVDTLAERGLFGLQLIAQEAKVAVDQQKASDDANIAAAQAHVDQVTAQTNAAVAQAQTNADLVQQQANAAEAVAKATEDSVAITSAINTAAAQAVADQAAIIAAVREASAQAHVDAVQFGTQQQQQEASANQKLVQAQGDSAVAIANSTLTSVTNASNAANQDAQNAYNQSQAYWTQMLSSANQALSTASNDASVQQALAQASLSAIQSQSAITEAKLTSIYNVDQEMANVEFAGATPFIVNQYGISNDPMAAAEAFSWAVRTSKVT